MTKKPSDKRSIKNVLINRPLQREFTLVMIAIMMTAALAVGAFIRLSLLEMSRSAPTTISRAMFEQLISDTSIELVAGSILIIFLAIVTTGFFGVLFLHRVAGPVYRFRQVLKRIARGEIPNEVQLRPHDFFKETAEEINYVIRNLKKKDQNLQRIYEHIEGIPVEKVPPELKEKVQQIRSALNQLRKSS